MALLYTEKFIIDENDFVYTYSIASRVITVAKNFEAIMYAVVEAFQNISIKRFKVGISILKKVPK